MKSAASLVEAPVARRLRESYDRRPQEPSRDRELAQAPPRSSRPLAPQAVGAEAFSRRQLVNSFGVAPSRVRRPRREWYRGEEPAALTKYLLDNYVVQARDRYARPPGTSYWEDEVRDARDLATLWAPALLAGLSFPDILAWIESHHPVLEHIEAFAGAGIRPGDLGPSRHDHGGPTLGARLSQGTWTVEKIIQEVGRRRSLS